MAHRLIIAVTIVWTLALSAAGCRSGPSFRECVYGLESRNPDVRRESAFGLGRVRIKDPEVRGAAVTRLAVMSEMDSDPLARSAALMGLSMQSPAKSVETAKLLRTDASPVVRADAARVMGMHGDASAIEPLIAMLKEETNEDARREAVKSLGKFREAASIDALITCLGDVDLSVAHAASRALADLSGEDLGMDAGAWKKWQREQAQQKREAK